MGGRRQRKVCLIRDNQYGSRIEEDILRRDFTINAMYYDPYAAKLVCHKSALDDIKQRRLRFIGPARERCREDPVRMLRALRLAAKNNLEMNKEIKQSVLSLGGLLRNVSPMRLFEEKYQMDAQWFCSSALGIIPGVWFR